MAWFEIRDFRPGISSLPGLSHPPGTATERNTFRCTAAESGALIPGPRLTREITHESLTVTEGAGLRSHGGWYISGIQAAGPVFSSDINNTARDIDLNRTELIFGFEWYEESIPPSANSTWYFQIDTYRRNAAAGQEDWRTVTGYPDGVADSKASIYPTWVSFDYTRANPGTPTEVGAPIVAFVPYRREPLAYPNPNPGNTNSTVDIIDSGDSGGTDGNGSSGDVNKPVEFLVAHQGRLVLFPLIPFGAGRTNHVWSNSEGYYFTTVNDPTSMDSLVGFFDQVFGMEIPSGYTFANSMTADELFIMKRKGGALVLRGDLADPTVVNYPNVKSPGFSQNFGVVTPLGSVYCCENGGVWTWEGGDTSQPLSKNQRPDFWRPKAPTVAGYADYDVAPTKNFQWQNRIHVPNNWFLDMYHLGWWKIWPNNEDNEWGRTDGVSFWMGDNDHNDRWGYFTPRMFDSDGGTVCYEFDERKRSQFYSWQSHPIAQSIEREVEAREVAVTASGFGRVTLTLRGKSGNERSTTFEFDNEFPQRIAKRLHLTDSLVQIQLEAESVSYPEDGEDSDDEAPAIHAVAVDIGEGLSV